MYTLLTFLTYASLACIFVALWKPWIYPVKDTTRFRAARFYLICFVLFFAISTIFCCGDSEKDASSPGGGLAGESASPVASLAWTAAHVEAMPDPGTGRDRLLVVIVPTDEQQAGAARDVLLAAASDAAVEHQKQSGAAVVTVNLIAQKAESVLAEQLLAQVIYIPDGKGFDGKAEPGAQWELRRAAKRGFTSAELEYLRLWAAKYRLFQSTSGTQKDALDAAVCAEMGVAAGSLAPFANTLETVAE